MAETATGVTPSTAYLAALMEQRQATIQPHGHVQERKYGSNAERQRAYRARHHKQQP